MALLRHRHGPLLFVLLLLFTLAGPSAVAAHAELVSSDPANAATVPGPFAGPIVLTYSEALKSGSHGELMNAGNTKVADGAIDTANPVRMTFSPATPLAAGKYTIQWTSVAADKDVARGQLTLTVAEPTPPPPTATPVPTAPPTLAPTLAPSPTTAPTLAPTTAPSPSAAASPVAPANAGSDVVTPIVAALALILIVALLLLRRGRTSA